MYKNDSFENTWSIAAQREKIAYYFIKLNIHNCRDTAC